MEINSDEIDKLKKDLNPDNFTNNRKDINIIEEIDKKNFYINDNENNNDNKKEEKVIIRNEKIEPQNKNEINNDINYGINIKNDNKNENVNDEENISEKLNNKNNSSNELEKGEFMENKVNQENKEEIKEEENIQELIPLKKDHREKYITLDREKQNLICKNCYLSGALETNLELNQEFIGQYFEEEEQKKLNE